MLFRVLTVCVIACLIMTSAMAQDDAVRERRRAGFLEKRQEIRDGLQRDLESVRQWCLGRGLEARAAHVAAVSEVLQSEVQGLTLPRMVRSDLPPDPADDRQQVDALIWHHRVQRATELYSLSRSALRADFPTLAYSMIEDVVSLDPDHQFARAILGTQLFIDPLRRDEPGYAGEWVSAFEARMRSGSKPQVDHPEFGWIPVAHVSRYEQGERPWRGGWISTQKESELRRDFASGWEIPSEHFLVKTNVSHAAGVEMSRRLETFYAWIQQHLPGFFETPEAMQERFENASRRRGSNDPDNRPMKVFYFATRDEYRRHLADELPPNFETNGFFVQRDGVSYFFRDEADENLSTLFHEATHQIFDHCTLEDRRNAARAKARRLRQRVSTDWTLCEKSNFWVIEGLACYFESFRITEDGVSVGDPSHIRIETARARILVPEYFYFVPMKTFFGLGQLAFQDRVDIQPRYTQAAGTAHFLMHYGDGMYRDDLVKLLSAIYRPDLKNILDEPRFDEISGVPFDELDRQYREHMQLLDDRMAEQLREPDGRTPGDGGP